MATTNHDPLQALERLAANLHDDEELDLTKRVIDPTSADDDLPRVSPTSTHDDRLVRCYPGIFVQDESFK